MNSYLLDQSKPSTKNSLTPDLYKITLVMYVLGLVVLHPKTVIRPLA